MSIQIILVKDLDIPSEVQEFIMAQAATIETDPEVPNSTVKNLKAWHTAIRLSACWGYQRAVTDLSSGSFKPDNTNGG